MREALRVYRDRIPRNLSLDDDSSEELKTNNYKNKEEI